MLKVFGIGESEMETRIMDLVERQSNPPLPHMRIWEISLRVTARAMTGRDRIIDCPCG